MSVSSFKNGKNGKKVGIVVSNQGSLYWNRFSQNAYFFYECCEAMGYSCQFLCAESNPYPFDHKYISIKQITTDSSIFNPLEYYIIVTTTVNVSDEVYSLLKSNKVCVIALVCGNKYVQDQEEFATGGDKVKTFLGQRRNIDEQWVIPLYNNFVEYMELIHKKPTFVVPYMWSPEIVKMNAQIHLRKSESVLFYNTSNRKSKKINLIIVEPNLNCYNSAWLPIIAAEKLHIKHPDLIHAVYVFDFPSHNHAHQITNTLTVASKIKQFARLTMGEIMDFFNNQSEHMPVIVSHQILNSLNYLYYEMLYYGYPLIHNSSSLEECGYKYSEQNVTECVEQILHAVAHHDKQLHVYTNKVKKYLNSVDPYNTTVQKAFDKMITSSIEREKTSKVCATYYSQIGQDKYFIENFTSPGEKGFFVDVGAHDGTTMSNTLALEKMGWKGLGIEVSDELYEQAKRNRTCKIVNECVFHTNDEEKVLEIPMNAPIAEGNSLLIRIKDLDSYNSSFKEQFKQTNTFTKRTKTLTKIFEENDVPHVIDFMSIDIEGADYDALLGLDYTKYKIRFLTIEWGGSDRTYLDKIQRLLESKGYKLHRINKWDAEFIPVEVSALIPKVVYINLAKRVDRRRQIEDELAKMELKAERFEAILAIPGSVGCSLSHIAVLKRAIAENWESVLILEDDFMFTANQRELEQKLQHFKSTVKSYDVLLLSCYLKQSAPYDNLLLRVKEAQTTSGYLVHKRFFKTLLANFEEGVEQLAKGATYTKYALDEYWKSLQKTHEWYCFQNRIGVQRQGFSDIENRMVNYGV